MKKEMIGKTFGLLKVVSEDGKTSGGETRYKCACECGGETSVPGSNLRRGRATHCGCRRAQSGRTKTIPVITAADARARVNSNYAEVPLGAISVKKNIRRSEVTAESDPGLAELAANIKEVGVIEPIILNAPTAGVEEYEVVAGHRRRAAAAIAELTTIPAIVYNGLSNMQVLEMQISENLHRADLSVIEEAEVYKRMHEELDMPVDKIAERIGRSQSHVYNYIRLLTLPDSVLVNIDSGKIGVAKANVLATLPYHVIDKVVNGDYQYVMRPNWNPSEFWAEIKRQFFYELDVNKDLFDQGATYTDDDSGKTYAPCAECIHRQQVGIHNDIARGKLCADENCYRAKRNIAERIRKKSGDNCAEYADPGDDFDDDDDVGIGENPNRRNSPNDDHARDWEREQREYGEAAWAKDRPIVEYYIDRKIEHGISATIMFDIVDDRVYEIDFQNVDFQLDEMLMKYIGKPIKQLREDASFEEVVRALFINYIIARVDNGDTYELAKWIGCEEYPDPQNENAEEEQEGAS